MGRELSAKAVAALKGKGLHHVGGVPGLGLLIGPTGGRSWILRIAVNGKRRDIGLGSYHDLTLAESRDKAREVRKQIRVEGVDPIEVKRTKLRTLAADVAMTFDDCAGKYIAAHSSGWSNPKHIDQWTNTLKKYASPIIGSLSVSQIDTPHILKILEPIWSTKTETATRVRGRIESVLDWATARKFRTGENPARWRGHLDKLMPKPSAVARIEHHRALPFDNLGDFMSQLRAAKGDAARALEFAILTACRSGEVRGATWGEIDLMTKVWTIPSDRMKAKKEHRFPLSEAAIDLLTLLQGTVDKSPLDTVFASSKGGPFSDMALLQVMHRLDVDAVPHGFRSTFRDWAGETTAYPREVIEHALAHQLKDKAEAAYARGSLFDKRRRLMDEWAAYCNLPSPQPGNVVPICRDEPTA